MFGTFESHYLYFCLKSRFFNFCEGFISDFGSLHYLLHLNELQDVIIEEKDLKKNR